MLNLLVAVTCKMKQATASDSIRVYQNSYITLLINKLITSSHNMQFKAIF